MPSASVWVSIVVSPQSVWEHGWLASHRRWGLTVAVMGDLPESAKTMLVSANAGRMYLVMDIMKVALYATGELEC